MELYELINILHGVDNGDLPIEEAIKAVRLWLAVVVKQNVP